MGGVLHRASLTALLTVLSVPADAGTGTADALILCLDSFAAQARLGSAAAAVAAGPWACAGNPSLLESGICASGGTAPLESATIGTAAAFHVGSGISAGLALEWLGHGGIQGRDESGDPTGEYSWSTGSLLGGVALQVMPGLTAGASLGPVWEKAGESGATGLTSSVGVHFDAIRNIDIGLVVENLGSAPEWNGIRKDMPVEITAGARFEPSGFVSVIGGGSMGFSTASRISAAAELHSGSIAVSGGWELVPGEGEAGGPVLGAGYIYSSSGVYCFDVAVRRDEFGWPVLAGLSARF